MKKRMIRAVILAVITTVALIVFIGLYIDEKRRVQETYREQFITELGHASLSVSAYLDAEGDLDMRYRRILSEISCANSFAFLLDNLTEEQKICMNELTSVLMRYPEQMCERERMEALGQTINDLQSNLDKGFDEAAEIVEDIDKKGH